jgi:hypothetical protein
MLRVSGGMRVRLAALAAVVLLGGGSLRAEDPSRLPDSFVVEGEDGAALAGAELVALERKVKGVPVLARDSRAVARADADGRLALPDEARDVSADPGFAVLAAGHAPRRLTAVDGGRLRLFPATKHTSRVRLPGGEAAANAALLLVPVGAPSAVALQLRSGADGTFGTDRLGPGLWRLVLERRGSALVLGGVTRGTWPGEVTVPAGGGVSGRLVEGQRSGSKGVPSLRVALTRLPRTDASTAQRSEARSDPDGRFLVAPLEPGIYELTLLDGDWRFDQPHARVEVPEGATRAETWFVAARPWVTGRVLHRDDLPLANAEVALLFDPAVPGTPAQPIPAPQAVRTDAEGRFHVPRLAPAKGVRVVVFAKGFAPLLSDPFEIGTREATDAGAFRLSGGWGLDVEVRDADGRLLPGAALEALPAAQPAAAQVPALAALVQRATTDREGSASLAHLMEDDLWLTVTAPGQLTTRVRVPRPASGGSRKERISLPRSPALSGRVQTLDGLPAPGLTVEARPSGAWDPPVVRTATDAVGTFKLVGLAPRPHDVLVLRGKHVLLQQDGVPADEAALELTLPPLLKIAGSVGGLLEAGAPAIALLEAPEIDPRGERRWRVVDREVLPSGLAFAFFAFEGLAAGEYAVRVAQGIRDTDALPVRLDDRDVDLQPLFIPTPGSVAGLVLDLEGHPILGAGLELVRLRGDMDAPPLPGGTLRASSDDRGGYLFPEVTPGLWRLSVREAGRGSDLEILRVEEGEALVVRDLLIDGGGRIAGTVRDPRGARLDGVRVRAWRVDLDAGDEEVRTRVDGTFDLPGLPPGTWRVVVGGHGAEPLRREALVEVRAGETVTVEFELGGSATLFGRVTRRNERVAGAGLRLEWSPDAGGALVRVHKGATDAVGEFEMTGLPAGAYSILLEDGATLTGGDVVLEEDERREVDLELFEGRVLGIVEDVSGRRVPYAEVEARPAREVTGELRAKARAGPDGRFTLSGLPLGRYDLVVRGPGRAEGVYRGASSEPPGIERPITVVLDRGAEIDVEVRGPAGRPVSGARLTVTVTDEQERASVEAITGPTGRIRLSGVPPGEVRVSAYARDLGRASGKIKVGEGETRRLELRVERSGSLYLQVWADAVDPTPRTRIDVVATSTGEVVARRRPLQPTWWSLLFGLEPKTGQVVLKDLTPGDYELRLEAGPRFQPAKTLVRVHGGEATRARVKLEPSR